MWSPGSVVTHSKLYLAVLGMEGGKSMGLDSFAHGAKRNAEQRGRENESSAPNGRRDMESVSEEERERNGQT